MNTILLTRGAPGSGKSTWINKSGLQQYTLSPDDIRLMVSSPVMLPDGSLGISQSNESFVWGKLFELLEKRMQLGELIIVDATHSTPRSLSAYKTLMSKYRYRGYIIDFTDVPMDVCLSRNANRTPVYKTVPEEVIRRIYSRYATFVTPKLFTTLKPDEVLSSFKLNPVDMNEYEKIYFIGDIHGCIEPLDAFLDKYYSPNNYYLFLGDLVDRGLDSVAVVERLMRLSENKNVGFIYGNHDQYLFQYANDEQYGRAFQRTASELNKANVDKKSLRSFMYKWRFVTYLSHHGVNVLATHGGVPTMIDATTALEQIIRGVGSYEDIAVCYDTWNSTMPYNSVQVNGHRNTVPMLPIQNGNCINLEGEVEFGGHLRIAIMSDEQWHYLEIKNNKVNPMLRRNRVAEASTSTTEPSEFIKGLMSNKGIKATKQFGNVYSFAFKNKVFTDGKWDSETIKARGLFANTATGEVVARCWNKSFNIGERASTSYGELSKAAYPITAYLKYNGFLGIVGYDSESDSLFVSSKTSTRSPHSEWFRNQLLERIGVTKLEELTNRLRDEKLSCAFEVMEPDNDPHIIEYRNRFIVLLDVFSREIDEVTLPYDELCDFAEWLGVQVKEKVITFDSWVDGVTPLRPFVEEVSNNFNYTYMWSPVEGFMLHASDGFAFKLKSNWYKTWKHLRGIADKVAGGRQVDFGQLHTPLHNYVYKFMLANREALGNMSIIEIRNAFRKSTMFTEMIEAKDTVAKEKV